MSDLPEDQPPKNSKIQLPEQMEKMHLRARIRTWLANARRRRVRLLLGRSISFLTLISFLVIVVVAVLGGIGLELTNRPVFCVSCHEMDVHYATWRESTHRSVTCEECHVMPGMLNMFKSKIKAIYFVYQHQKGGVKPSVIRGHVPDETCRHCHQKTHDLVVYHSLKITHKKHWGMKFEGQPIQCTFCHNRVVHGPRIETIGAQTGAAKDTTTRVVVGAPLSMIYPPTMETCFKCHDGKKLSNQCSLCHTSLGTRPSTFSPEWVDAHKENVRQEGNTCGSCHQQDFCKNCHTGANPHPAGWDRTHPEGYKKNPASCPTCHRGPNEKATDISMAFCRSCHTVKRAHAQANWLALHAQEFKAAPQKCSRCHTESWCAACHKISRAHPADWLQAHPAQAKQKPDSCRVCHEESFCIACHKGQGPGSTPASHQDKSAWLKNHKFTVREGGVQCSICHPAAFCQTCHKSVIPTSHDRAWVKSHGLQAQVNMTDCEVCHAKSYCSSCHGLEMPHPADWVRQHDTAAVKSGKTCQKCHATDYCQSCHRGLAPSSHQPIETWLTRHGKAAKSGKEKCEMCHRAALCDSCHGLKLPHTSGWLPKGHAAQAKTDAQTCARCHKADYCSSCHGLPMPHPTDWMESHPKNAQASFKKDSVCFRCHKTEDCSTCHGSPLPQK